MYVDNCDKVFEINHFTKTIIFLTEFFKENTFFALWDYFVGYLISDSATTIILLALDFYEVEVDLDFALRNLIDK